MVRRFGEGRPELSWSVASMPEDSGRGRDAPHPQVKTVS